MTDKDLQKLKYCRKNRIAVYCRTKEEFDYIHTLIIDNNFSYENVSSWKHNCGEKWIRLCKLYDTDDSDTGYHYNPNLYTEHGIKIITFAEFKNIKARKTFKTEKALLDYADKEKYGIRLSNEVEVVCLLEMCSRNGFKWGFYNRLDPKEMISRMIDVVSLNCIWVFLSYTSEHAIYGVGWNSTFDRFEENGYKEITFESFYDMLE